MFEDTECCHWEKEQVNLVQRRWQSQPAADANLTGQGLLLEMLLDFPLRVLVGVLLYLCIAERQVEPPPSLLAGQPAEPQSRMGDCPSCGQSFGRCPATGRHRAWLAQTRYSPAYLEATGTVRTHVTTCYLKGSLSLCSLRKGYKCTQGTDVP